MSLRDQVQPLRDTLDVVIASGGSLSPVVDLGSLTPLGIVMPAAWDAAGLTFMVSADGTTFYDLYDDAATEVAVAADASRVVRLDPANWAGFRYIKIRSGTTGSPVNQNADRTLTLLLRPV